MHWSNYSPSARTGTAKSLQDAVGSTYSGPGSGLLPESDARSAVDYLGPVCVVAGGWNGCLLFLRISEKPFATVRPLKIAAQLVIECRPCSRINSAPRSPDSVISSMRRATLLRPTETSV